jgi:HlyD family secretion protein
MTQNVVTYTVEVVTDNSDGRLLPYLTANAQFELSRSSDVLLVPNAALRWFPRDAQVDPQYRDIVANTSSGSGAVQQAHSAHKGSKTKPGWLWTPDGTRAKPLRVAMGPSDGTFTEVQGEGLSEGLEVIIGEARTAADGDTHSPFAPTPLGGSPQKK